MATTTNPNDPNEQSSTSPSSIYTEDTSSEKSSGIADWWTDNGDYVVGGLTGIGAILLGALGGPAAYPAAATLGAASIGAFTNASNNKNKDQQYEKEVEDQIEAEKRANEEYDRRTKEANAYNEAWMLRAQQQGINPISLLGSGSANSNYTASAPATSSMPRGAGYAKTAYNPSQALAFSSELAAIENQQAQTHYLNEQSAAQHEQGYAQFMANCFTRYQSGDKGTYSGVQTIDFDPKYKLSQNEEGDWIVTQMSPEERKQYSQDKNGNINIDELSFKVTTFESDQYGPFNIYDNSYAVRMLNENLTKVIGENNAISQSISDAMLNAYLSAVSASNDGKKTKIAEFEKNCKALATLWQYGTKEDATLLGLDEYNPSNWKWWAKFITQDAKLNFGTLIDLIPNIKSFLPKTSTTTNVDADGVITGGSTTVIK